MHTTADAARHCARRQASPPPYSSTHTHTHLPAIVDAYYASSDRLPPPSFLRVSCASCTRWRGTGPFLHEMLIQLVKSASSQEGLAAAAAVVMPPPGDCCAADFDGFFHYFHLLPRDRLTFILMGRSTATCCREMRALAGSTSSTRGMRSTCTSKCVLAVHTLFPPWGGGGGLGGLTPPTCCSCMWPWWCAYPEGTNQWQHYVSFDVCGMRHFKQMRAKPVGTLWRTPLRTGT